MQSRVFVIGAGGFLGGEFLSRINGAFEVVACDSSERLQSNGLNGIEYDFGNTPPEVLPCKRGDTAVIFSWRGYPAAHESDPVGKLSLNLNHTIDLLTWLARCGVSKVLYASSGGAIYGNVDYAPVSESVVPNPIGFYGIGKATAEMYVRKICLEHGVRHLIFRIGNAYGPEQLRKNLSVGLLAKAVAAAKTGSQIQIWGARDNRRDYIHAEDVARGFLAGLECSLLESGVYNLGSGEALSISDLIVLVQTTLGARIDVLNQPGRSFDVGSICLDCSKFQRATNWQTTWSLRDGILQLAKLV